MDMGTQILALLLRWIKSPFPAPANQGSPAFVYSEAVGGVVGGRSPVIRPSLLMGYGQSPLAKHLDRSKLASGTNRGGRSP